MVTQRPVRSPKRGDVYLVGFDPAIGAEIQKARPALIVQNDVANRWSPITIVAAITSQFGDRLYPTEVLFEPPEGGLSLPSVALLNQVRSIDKRRLLKKLGAVRPATMDRVERALRISFDLR